MTDSMWELAWKTTIPQQIKDYNTLVDSFKNLRKARTAEEVIQALETFQYGNMDFGASKTLDAIHDQRDNFLPTTLGFEPEGTFALWVKINFNRRKIGLSSIENRLETNAYWLKEVWKDKVSEKEDKLVVGASQDFLKSLDDYSDLIQSLLKQIYPPRFPYRGFTILNSEKIAKPLANEMLSAVDFIVTYFKNHGMLKTLQKGIKAFSFDMEDSLEEKTVAYFNTKTNVIGIYSTYLNHNRALNEWMKTNLVHEIGHYIHIKHLNPNARRYWDSWWDKIDHIRAQKEKIQELISWKERQKFFKKLVKAKFDLKKYRPDDMFEQIRFTSWLLNPTLGDRLYRKLADTGLRGYKQMPDLTEYGKKVFQALADPDTDPDTKADYLELLQIHDRVSSPAPFPAAQSQFVSYHLADEMEWLEDLELPTSYAETNRLEDFAETFARFMTDPKSLSDLATFRLQKTLSLSGLYGKPVMRLANDSSKKVLLYHVTGKRAALRAKKTYLGLDRTDYLKYVAWASKEFSIDKDYLLKFISWKSSGELEGDVSFWPNKSKAIHYANYENKSKKDRGGGEYKRSFLRQLLTGICRHKKISINSPEGKSIWKGLLDKFEANDPVVIIEVLLPISLLVNPQDISEGVEVYTKGKVPKKYITRIIDPKKTVAMVISNLISEGMIEEAKEILEASLTSLQE